MSREAPRRKHIWVDLLLYPTHTLPIAAAPVMVGAALAARDHVFAPMAVVLAFLGSWLIHLAGLFTDTHELLRRYPQVLGLIGVLFLMALAHMVYPTTFVLYADYRYSSPCKE